MVHDGGVVCTRPETCCYKHCWISKLAIKLHYCNHLSFHSGKTWSSSYCDSVIEVNQTLIMCICFPVFQDALFPYVFIVYMVFIIILWALLYVYIPETKGKTFEQISRELRRKLKHSINNEHNDINDEN